MMDVDVDTASMDTIEINMMGLSVDTSRRAGESESPVASSPVNDHNNNNNNNSERMIVEVTSKSENIIFDRTLPENPNETNALNSPDVFFDMNDRWRRAYMQEMYRGTTTSKDTDLVLLCPDDLLIASMFSEDESITTVSNPPPRLSPPMPKDFFRDTQNRRSKALDNDDTSPCGVVDVPLDAGHIYFWHRSLAWSEEESDDMTRIQIQDQDRILEHLSIPAKLGREYANENPPLPSSTPHLGVHSWTDHHRAIRRDSTSYTSTLEKVELDNTTRVHWEEKVLSPSDTSHVELMSRLTID
jgi:hypothetical protein